jgi:ATP-binding cassette subfamily B multidrug efflux pump
MSTKKSIDFNLFKRLLAYFKPYKAEFIFGFLTTLIGAGTALLPPFITKYAIDEYITNDVLTTLERFDGISMMVFIFIGSLFLNFYMMYIKGYVTAKLGQKAIRDLRINVFAHLQRLSLKYFDSNPIGTLMTRVTNDIEALNSMFTQGVVTIFGDIFMILGIVISLVVINPTMAMWTFSVLPLLFIISFIFRINVRKNLTKVRALVAELNAFIQENVTGMQIVKLFNQEKQNVTSFEKLNQKHTSAWVENVMLYSVYFPTVELVSSIAIAFIIWNAGFQVQNNAVTYGTIVLFIQMAQMFFRPISDLSEKYNIIQSAMAASERVFDVLDTNEIIQNPEHAVMERSFSGKIEFKHVWFSYKENPAEDDYVIRDVSFTVNPGETVAIVGHTGAGKSTIINLVSRFYDIQKGEIFIDGKNVKEWDVPNLRSYIGTVLQDIYLFSGTVYDNIGLGSKHITNELIEAACKRVYAESFINKLSDGYATQLKERGGILSTGQKQLLSFARAVVFNPALLILDEATSSIDTETEQLIQKAIDSMMVGRTSIVIAHRLSTIQNADQIIVMHHGKIREHGSHQDLLAEKGLYHKLYQLQYKEQEVG